MASTISVCGEPERVNLVVRAVAGLLIVGHLSPSPIGNFAPVDYRGSAGKGASSAILF